MSRKGAKDGAAAYVLYQQKRRSLALERQKQSRQEKLQDFRSLGVSASQNAETALPQQQVSCLSLLHGQSNNATV